MGMETKTRSSSGSSTAYKSAVESTSQVVNSQTSGKSSATAGEEQPYHPALVDPNDCQYVGEWGDCDPFRMVRVKTERLITGGATCLASRNITKPCSRDDLPPGTNWLIKEHNLCVQELQKLKSMIGDLHRYIDLIHQRGQALFNSYNELRKRLIDLRKQITIIGKNNHNIELTITRLRKEVENWKNQSNRMQMELNQLKAQYKGLEIKVRALKIKSEEYESKKQDLSQRQLKLNSMLDQLKTENRNLKTNVLDAERYTEQLKKARKANIAARQKIEESKQLKEETKRDLNKCRLELAMPGGAQGKPKINKDTKVNLDMSMWITHNITMEEGVKYEPVLKTYEGYADKKSYGTAEDSKY